MRDRIIGTLIFIGTVSMFTAFVGSVLALKIACLNGNIGACLLAR